MNTAPGYSTLLFNLTPDTELLEIVYVGGRWDLALTNHRLDTGGFL